MPTFDIDLESFTTITLDAESEAAALRAVRAVLDALGSTEYVVGDPRPLEGGSAGRVAGRPSDARRQLGAILRLLSEGVTRVEIARRLNVHPVSIWRALKWAKESASSTSTDPSDDVA